MENNTMSLEQAIAEVVRGFNRGCIFDAHAVIDELLNVPEYREIYNGRSFNPISSYHSYISRLIGKIVKAGDAPLAEDVNVDSCSHNIYKRTNRCKCWIKK